MGGLPLSFLKRFAYILSLIVACFVTLPGGISIACEQLALPFVLYLESLWITL